YDGVVYWTGAGNDTVTIDGTHYRAGLRTTTSLNTGLGDDTATVTLLNTPGAPGKRDDFFVLDTSGGRETGDPIQHLAGASDKDMVDAHNSTLPLVIFGGFDNDTIIGGKNND